MDTARTARRLGATDALVVYRRTRDRMPAHDVEVTEALEEGVTVKWLSTITHADAGTITMEKMRLDDTGFPQPTGEFEELSADTVILAIGQEADLSLLAEMPGIQQREGTVTVDATMMTGYPGVFAGGDMVPGERTVTVSIGHGKKAAHAIDAWLRNASLPPVATPQLASYDKLNTWYYSDAPATVRPRLDAARRVSTFDEVIGGLGGLLRRVGSRGPPVSGYGRSCGAPGTPGPGG
jgi:pyruvate/2-oxoglutarate dehydrogenase complex dihydrolipoamide dehydrogenase (E3) component